ncbi:hypothetical protein NEHOM01_1995 [Nematocida homosporus]|uniref:uncharacterized protein n=1 Tax=Nematocida homosporus TaxID=1912981 RepID=UPI00221F8402|nr:uncharacterized protein NEHOM01_1995 [Nematocida homosporus]KAI5187190.1 hypothetical protein NEHOM01_1995 [Nematocida homosporus]
MKLLLAIWALLIILGMSILPINMQYASRPLDCATSNSATVQINDVILGSEYDQTLAEAKAMFMDNLHLPHLLSFQAMDNPIYTYESTLQNGTSYLIAPGVYDLMLTLDATGLMTTDRQATLLKLLRDIDSSTMKPHCKSNLHELSFTDVRSGLQLDILQKQLEQISNLEEVLTTYRLYLPAPTPSQLRNLFMTFYSHAKADLAQVFVELQNSRKAFARVVDYYAASHSSFHPISLPFRDDISLKGRVISLLIQSTIDNFHHLFNWTKKHPLVQTSQNADQHNDKIMQYLYDQTVQFKKLKQYAIASSVRPEDMNERYITRPNLSLNNFKQLVLQHFYTKGKEMLRYLNHVLDKEQAYAYYILSLQTNNPDTKSVLDVLDRQSKYLTTQKEFLIAKQKHLNQIKNHQLPVDSASYYFTATQINEILNNDHQLPGKVENNILALPTNAMLTPELSSQIWKTLDHNIHSSLFEAFQNSNSPNPRQVVKTVQEDLENYQNVKPAGYDRCYQSITRRINQKINDAVRNNTPENFPSWFQTKDTYYNLSKEAITANSINHLRQIEIDQIAILATHTIHQLIDRKLQNTQCQSLTADIQPKLNSLFDSLVKKFSQPQPIAVDQDTSTNTTGTNTAKTNTTPTNTADTNTANTNTTGTNTTENNTTENNTTGTNTADTNTADTKDPTTILIDKIINYFKVNNVTLTATAVADHLYDAYPKPTDPSRTNDQEQNPALSKQQGTNAAERFVMVYNEMVLNLQARLRNNYKSIGLVIPSDRNADLNYIDGALDKIRAILSIHLDNTHQIIFELANKKNKADKSYTECLQTAMPYLTDHFQDIDQVTRTKIESVIRAILQPPSPTSSNSTSATNSKQPKT